MQISDLNTNLLNIVTGQNSKKSEDDQKNSGFMGLLQALENSKVDSVSDADLGADYRANASQASEQPRVSKADMKKVDKQDNKSKPQDSVKTEKKGKQNNSVKTSEKGKVENGRAGQGAAVENQVRAEDETQGVVVPVQPLLFAFDDEVTVPELVLDDDVVDVEGRVLVENMPVERVVLSEENSLQLPMRDIVENVDTFELEPVVEEEDVSDNLINFSTETNVKAEEDKPVHTAEAKNVIQEQEEKIAELLPEDEKVEIKVSVKEDKVTASNNENKVSFEVASIVDEVVEDDIVKDVVDEEVFVAEDEDSDGKIQDIKSPISSMPVTSEVSITETPVVSDVEEISQVQLVANVANDVKAPNQAVKADNFNTVQDKGLTREVAEQIKVNITQSAIKGVDKIEIQLKPADLGQVEIKLHISKDGKIQAHIIASNTETLEILQKDSSFLKDAFTNAGYQAEDGSFSFSHRGEEQNDEREKLREFIGEVLTQDVAEEIAANDYIREDGVNIRV